MSGVGEGRGGGLERERLGELGPEEDRALKTQFSRALRAAVLTRRPLQHTLDAHSVQPAHSSLSATGLARQVVRRSASDQRVELTAGALQLGMKLISGLRRFDNGTHSGSREATSRIDLSLTRDAKLATLTGRLRRAR